MLQELIELSREGSSDKRREVLQKVSNLFVEGAETFSDRETLLFADIMNRLLDQVQLEDRIALSERIARIDQTPHDLVLKLASDVADVAAPVLEFSTVLTDSDLMQLVSEKGQDHLLAISRRSNLSESVTDIIVERGENRVLTTVAHNTGAQFSQAGFSALAQKAATTPGLGEILSRRADLPRDAIARILPLLNTESRARMQFLVEHDNDQLDSLMTKTQAEVDASRKYINRERIEIRLILADIRDKKRTLADALGQLIQEKRVSDIAHLLADLSGVPISQVANVIHKSDSTAIASICQVLDVTDESYEKLSRLRCEKLKLPPTTVDRYMREYQALDKATAERALRFHKVRQGAQL